MDRIQLLLVGLPLFLFSTDIFNLFISSPPPKPSSHHHHHHHQQHIVKPSSPIQQTLDFPSQQSNALGYGHTVTIDFCSSCSYKGTAVAMKNMLETQFPGINVALANYPPPPPKRILSKLVPVAQVGVFAIIMAGDQIFPRLGMTPPPWFYTLRANRFGTISATWLFGNFIQSYLQSSGAFEVYFDGEPVFSKLAQQRFPGEIELRDLIGKRLAVTKIVDGAGATLWS
ncbi:selT-like protein [Chenopodium quinoa]|uniref:selT-like protein n=1 Tax=Chenopodium quinoa TaxID=63459 RepID=UPI000B796702|nr:selT-like protein [Chenopodium quinoa]